MSKQRRLSRRTGVRRLISHYSILLSALLLSVPSLTMLRAYAGDTAVSGGSIVIHH